MGRRRSFVKVVLYRRVRYLPIAMSRPKSFDEQRALEQAMHLFWRNGYEGTSLTELTEAMGINRPSLYATFGNKEALFRRAMDLYAKGPGAAVAAALAAKTAREVVEQLFRVYAEAPSDPKRPRGCLMVNGALRCSTEAEPVRLELEGRRAGAIAALKKRLERAQREGDLGKDESAGELARYVWTVLQGMAVQSVDGASSAQLRQVAARALRSWPD
jgi:AcrR family transcriptional regulator